MRNVTATATDSWRSYMQDGAPEADMDERGTLHGHAEPSASRARAQGLRRAAARVLRLRGARVGAAVLLLVLGALLVHHWTGPAHALTAEERARRFLARTEREAGRVPADEAYVTVATGEREAAGVFALAASLVAARATRMLRVLVTPDVPRTVRTQLARLPNVAAVAVVGRVPVAGDTASAQRARFTRMRAWDLPGVACAVYLDPRTVVRRNTDALFVLRPRSGELYAAYNPDADAVCNTTGTPRRALNTSVMVLRPSSDLFDRLASATETIAQSPARAATLTEAEVIQAVFEDSTSGTSWRPLPRPLYGMSAAQLCVCGPSVAERARVVHIATDAPPVTTSATGPAPWKGTAASGGMSAVLGGNGVGVDKMWNATAIHLQECLSNHRKLWRKYYRDAQKLLL